mgnify:CR=1 FL=1
MAFTAKRKVGEPRQKPKQAATSYGLWCLSRKNWSVQEMKTKLTTRGYSVEESDVAVARLMELGYLNDSSFAQSKVRSLSARKGNRAVAQVLKQAGVGQADIETALDDAQDEVTRAMRCAEKFRGKCQTREETGKVWRFLAYRGFSASTIKMVVSAIGGASSDTPDD